MSLTQRFTIAAVVLVALVLSFGTAAVVFQKPIDRSVERERLPVRKSTPCLEQGR